MSLSLAVSITVFALIAIREWLPQSLKIWHIMSAGALVLLVSGEIAPEVALQSVDWNVMLYLFSVFSIGRALYENGFSHRIARWMLGWTSAKAALIAFMLIFAIIAAILTNDAAAIIGTPIALMLARQTGTKSRSFLIALCVAVTIGSMCTPMGNPQNLLIASSGELPAPLVTFLLWLLVPTGICLAGAAYWLARGLQPVEDNSPLTLEVPPQVDRQWPVLLAVAVLVFLVLAESLLTIAKTSISFPLGVAAALAAVPVYLFDTARVRVLRELDWTTLIFFLTMFVVTGSLINSGTLQTLLGDAQDQLTAPWTTAAISFLGSQLFSNVPLVDMYLKLLPSFETANLMMLAGISTLAGNVFIISAASNVIVLQQASQMGAEEVSLSQFMRDVLPIGVVSALITAGWVIGLDQLLRTLT